MLISEAAILELDHLSVTFGRKRVLNDVCGTISDGSIIGILGANGSGKSTTLRAIAGSVAIDSGSLRYDGEELNKSTVRHRVYRGLTLVPQGRRLFGSMTIDEKLAMGAFLRSDRQEIARDRDEIYSFIPELNAVRYRRAKELSGGQQQMVAVARGLMARPRVLLVDEPSLGVAPKVIERLGELLLQLRDKLKMTIVLVEQNVGMALAVSDRIFVLHGGRIAADATPESLKDRRVLESIYFGTEEQWR